MGDPRKSLRLPSRQRYGFAAGLDLQMDGLPVRSASREVGAVVGARDIHAEKHPRPNLRYHADELS